MAYPGVGFRSVLSVAIEISAHLVEPWISTTLTSPVAFGGYGVGGYGQGGYGVGSELAEATVSVGSLGIPINALYVGAQVVVDVGNNQEIVTVLSVTPATNSFSAYFIFQHPVGALVQGATFPTQAESGDPFFTQTEVLSYIARAQNQFLADVPCIFGINTQWVQPGQIYQQLICDAISMERCASSSLFVSLVSLTRAGVGGYGTGGYGTGGYGGGGTVGTVTAISASPHGFLPDQKFSIYDPLDPSFVGAFKVAAVIDANTFTYRQDQPDATTTGGAAVLWLRLLETSAQELSIQNPFWRNQTITQIRSFYEDRTGNYRWGVDGRPATRLPAEILVSQRDTDTLEMTDYFLVPDICLHGVKYLSLFYAWSKDSEQRSPLLASYAKMRYDRIVLATQRWMDGLAVGLASKGMASKVAS